MERASASSWVLPPSAARRRRTTSGAATDLDLTRRLSTGTAGGSEPLGGVPVTVLVRCRPALGNPKAGSSKVVSLTAEPKGPGRLALHVDPGEAVEGGSKGSGSGAEQHYARDKGRALEAKTFRCNGFCGQESTQESVFKHAEPIVDRVMEGYNGTIFCYGITGSGKSFTMSGPPSEDNSSNSSGNHAQQYGVVQRAAQRIFEFIRDRSGQGEVFSVEASFMEIYSHDGVTETLLDLLAEGNRPDAKLEIHQDPLNKQAFVCNGLTSLPISSPQEMYAALDAGRRRCTFMETTRNCHSSRSHCLFVVNIENLPNENSSDQLVKRGKLVLVDLAGSESLKKVVAASDTDEALRRRQAIGINRVLSHLGTVVNNLNAGNQAIGYRNSALTMLLRDCLGGAARALLIANIGPESEWCSETYMTLTFAQKMMQVRNVEKQTLVGKDKSTLLQMRERHLECIARLREGAADGEMHNGEDMEKLQAEVKSLSGRLLTKSNVTETLERLELEQRQKMEELRSEMTQTMATHLATFQEQSVKEFADLQEVIATKTREGGEMVEKQLRAFSEAQLTALQDSLTAAHERHKTTLSDVAQLRVQLGAAEQRVQLLQDLQKDFVTAKEELEHERQAVRQQAEEQQDKVLTLDRELNRYRVEADVLREQVEQQKAVSASDAATAHAEREAWNKRETELKSVLSKARDKLAAEQARCHKVAEDSAAHRKAMDELRSQVLQLEAEATVQKRQLDEAKRVRVALEDEVFEAQELENSLVHQLHEDRQIHDEELDLAAHEVSELERMNHELQNSIMSATSRAPNR